MTTTQHQLDEATLEIEELGRVIVRHKQRIGELLLVQSNLLEALKAIQAMASNRKKVIRMPSGMILDNFCSLVIAKATQP